MNQIFSAGGDSLSAVQLTSRGACPGEAPGPTVWPGWQKIVWRYRAQDSFPLHPQYLRWNGIVPLPERFGFCVRGGLLHRRGTVSCGVRALFGDFVKMSL